MTAHKRNAKIIRLNFYLIRHAESVYNVSGKVQGHLDSELSQNGIEQAISVAKLLREKKFDFCFTSDLMRASHTAEYIIAENKFKENIKYLKEKLLRERNFGEVQGRDKSYFIEKAQEANVSFEDFIPNGAESKGEIVTRWKNFFENLCQKMWYESEKDELDIMVVSHGAFMRESIKFMLKNYNCEFNYDLKELDKSAPNSSVTRFYVIMETRPDCDYSICYIKFESFYDKSHLENLSETQCDL
ncbi:fructose-2-6-bisphosphatase TIGAR B-like [Brachionus plicatilis]|uniref:Fructose-2-6-bisphosphatase TIGAR B-like n=1 Tax=Brachionus plicatilis TaxID=10195 RepID=A0A3M7SFY2_BRAPC|nr:fructose-2-6-bisphosphatase TIGAR B-like [Brachionus plicatilis]